MILAITYRDIQKALEARGTEGYEDTYSCPIAQSIRRRFPYAEKVLVADGIISVGFKTVATPAKAQDFISAFDNEETVSPCRIELDI